MLEIIITNIVLGITLAAPIGPVNAEMIKRGLVGGFWSAFSVRLGGAIANSICLIIAYFGLGHLKHNSVYLFGISCLGEVILIYMGVGNIIKATSKNFMINMPGTCNNILNSKKIRHHYSIKNGIMLGMILAFTSPIGLMFWLSTFAATIQQEKYGNNLSLANLLIKFFIIFGVLLWGSLVSLALHFGSKIINKRKLRIVSCISGIILIYFGVKYGIKTLESVKFLTFLQQ